MVAATLRYLEVQYGKHFDTVIDKMIAIADEHAPSQMRKELKVCATSKDIHWITRAEEVYEILVRYLNNNALIPMWFVQIYSLFCTSTETQLIEFFVKHLGKTIIKE